MTLDRDLYDGPMSRPCDFCGHEMVRPGRWFALLRGSFVCEACLERNPFGYEAKSRLFDHSAQRLLNQIEQTLDTPVR